MKKNLRIQYPLESADYSVEQLLEVYVHNLEALNRSPKTISRYIYSLMDFIDYLKINNHSMSISLITRGDIINYINHIKNSQKWFGRKNFEKNYGNLSPFTIAGRVRDLKAFWGWLSRENYCEKNIMSKYVLPKVPQYILKIPSREQLKQILSYIDKSKATGFKYYCIILLLLDTGMRISELVSIKLSDIDMLNGSIKIMGKGYREREVPFSSPVRKELNSYIKSTRFQLCYENNPYLFPNGYEHVTASSVQQYMGRLSDKAGLDNIRFHPHLLRHTCATNMVANGANVYAVKDILGHRSLQTTLKYTHLQINDLKREHNKFSPVGALIK